jgi:hypothetical protein
MCSVGHEKGYDSDCCADCEKGYDSACCVGSNT